MFTGADLRDWHEANADPGQHVVLTEALNGVPLLSWEHAAQQLRNALVDPARCAVERPDQLRSLLGLYLQGVLIGRASAFAEAEEKRQVV